MIIRDIIYRKNMVFTGYNDLVGDYLSIYDEIGTPQISIESYYIGAILVKLLNFDFTEIIDNINNLAVRYEELYNPAKSDNVIDLIKKINDNAEKINGLIEESPLFNICTIRDVYYYPLSELIDDLISIDNLNGGSGCGTINGYIEAVKLNSSFFTFDLEDYLKDFEKNIILYKQLSMDIQDIQKIYAYVIDEYIGKGNNFDEAIVLFEKNNIREEKPFFTFRQSQTKHRISADGQLELFIKFDNLGDFIYHEFFKAFEIGHTIKRCKHCGQIFLNVTKYDVEYCDNIVDKKSGKTCRGIGAEKSHQDKVKNNPVLLVYQRAYKTHYARTTKKTMTQSEFEKWGKWAMEMREKALNGEIPFDEYERELKK